MDIDFTKFGPFATTMVVATALLAIFSVLLLQLFGRKSKWAKIAGSQIDFVTVVPARVLTVVAMGLTYATIDAENYLWFSCLAMITGVSAFALIGKLQIASKIHVASHESIHVVIGTEEAMNDTAQAHFEEAREKFPALTLKKFVFGYPEEPPEPEAVWNIKYLADIEVHLARLLSITILLTCFSVFLVSVAIESSGKFDIRVPESAKS